MSISSISSASAATGAAPGTISSTSTPPATKTLGVDDFMKLLATQFEQQDPMKPMDDTAFIAQTAQFTQLQQTTTLTQQMTQLRANQDFSTANSYIGRKLTVNAGNGLTASGNVTAVDASGSAPQLIINGQPYPLSAVLYVEPGAVSTPTPPPATTGGTS